MDRQILSGKLVRLAAQDPAKDAQIVADWEKDTVYTRLLAVEPVTPPNPKARRERMEHSRNEKFFPFAVRTLADDKLIGFVILMHVNHVHGDAFVGIGMGDPEYRGRGYGTDAMNLILRFAFQELNLHRVSLDTLGNNARAIRSYEKCGFVCEGLVRGAEHRGERDDIVAMGALRAEWLAKQDDA